jgi:hypothetical protein
LLFSLMNAAKPRVSAGAILREVQAGWRAPIGPVDQQEESRVSDQDFFFDEDDQPAAEDKAPAKKTSTSTKSAAAPAAVGAAQSVSMSVAALIGVIALLAGVIIGIVLPVGGGSTGSPAGSFAPPANSAPAPQLSPDQLEGDLPPGHPPLDGQNGGMGSGEETPTEEPEGN